MDPSIWSKLPEDLLYKIISFLPLKSISSLRPTSKKFNSLLSTPHFLSLINTSSSSSQSSSSSFLILSHPQLSHRFLSLYSSSSDQWRNLPLSSPSSSLLSSSSGLLLFSNNSSSFFVLNPLTNCSIKVPSPIFPVHSASLLSSHSNSKSNSPHGFKIFFPDPNSESVHIYDSGNRYWAEFPGLPSVTHNSNSHQNGVSFRGSLLFTTPEPYSIVAFDSETGKWAPGVTAELPNGLTFVRLVSSGERLYLVCGVGRDGISRSVKVWALNEAWEEVGYLPELMCRKFGSVCYHNYSHVYCVWHEGMICVCCVTWPEVLFFKVGRGTWHWLTKCPFLLDKWSCGFSWFSFVPDLYALV